ncbi:hypothetical protein TWF102_004933 [Orbilia oligospora]|uniref:Uncharacterized protein n=1 Tax=Orbilia oligospora TaxID=2813651 RepID=A0A7C8NRT5_ORBOL|nr:hypothetical protein TWF102_004933 [Orbilia oligospora]
MWESSIIPWVGPASFHLYFHSYLSVYTHIWNLPQRPTYEDPWRANSYHLDDGCWSSKTLVKEHKASQRWPLSMKLKGRLISIHAPPCVNRTEKTSALGAINRGV